MKIYCKWSIFSYSVTYAVIFLCSWFILTNTICLYCVGLRKATDRALNALEGMRRGLKGNGERKKRLKSELASAFISKSKKPKKRAWKHRFVCLAWRDQHKIPTTDVEKDDLLEAGLGEKVIEFPSLDANGEEFKEIYSEYPKLRDGGGFELCRCLPNSRNLEALLTSVALSSPAMLKERVGNARTYIRPLQCDLDMDAVLGLPKGVSTVHGCNLGIPGC